MVFIKRHAMLPYPIVRIRILQLCAICAVSILQVYIYVHDEKCTKKRDDLLINTKHIFPPLTLHRQSCLAGSNSH